MPNHQWTRTVRGNLLLLSCQLAGRTALGPDEVAELRDFLRRLRDHPDIADDPEIMADRQPARRIAA